MLRLVHTFPLAVFFLFIFVATSAIAADPGGRLIESQVFVQEGSPFLRLRVAVDNMPGLLVPQKAGEWRREERHVTDPVTGEEEVWVLEGPAPDLSLRSFLIAVPDGYAPPAGPRTVLGELVDLATGEVVLDAGPIEGEVRSAQVGMVRAAQVFYRLPDMERPVEARFDVSFAAESGPRRSIGRAAERSVSTLFVNPQDAVIMIAADRRSSTPSILEPPGDIRIGFKAENRVYRVPMASMGVDEETVEGLKLLHHGATIPFDIEGEDLIFYAQRRVTASDVDDSIFAKLVVEGASPRLATREAFNTLTAPEFPTEVEVVRNRRFDWDLQYQPAVVSLPLGSKFVYHRLRWPGNSTYPASRAHELPIFDVMTNTFISMKVEAHGRNVTPNFDPDHYAVFSLGAVTLPQISWKGNTKRISTFNFTLASLPTGPVDTLTFDHRVPGNTPVTVAGNGDEQVLDLVEITYLAYPRLEGGVFGRLTLPPAGSSRTVTMGGLPIGTGPDDVFVLDVTDSLAPIRLLDPHLFPDSSGTVGVIFEVPSKACVIQIELLDSLAPPVEVTVAERLPERLPAATVLRGIVVRDAMYADSLRPWIDHRGPGILEMDPRAGYNVFNGGQASPESIRESLKFLIDNSEETVAVPFVILVGHGSFDRKDRLGLKEVPWIPPFLELGAMFDYNPVTGVGTTIENSVDLDFGLLFGDDNLLDVQLARWPVKSVADVERVVSRAFAHDVVANELVRTDRPAYFFAQNEPVFVNDQNIWKSLWGSNGFAGVTIAQSVPVPELGGLMNTPAIRKAFEKLDDELKPLGASFFLYTGHGNFDQWTNTLATSFTTTSHPINNPNVATFDTTNKWPVVATYTCLNGNYASPGQTRLSMAEAWIVGTDFGAIATVAPCGVDYYNEQRLLQGAYLNQLGNANPLERAVTVGEMSHRASVQYATQYPSLMKTLREYIVFGDPLALTTVVPQQAELIVTVASSVESVKDGVPFELTVMVENVGTAEARGVELQLPLPVGVLALDVQSEWGETTSEAGMVTLSFGSLLPGQSASGVVTVVTEPGSPNPVELTTTAVSVTPPAGDPASDTASVIILRQTEMMSIY